MIKRKCVEGFWEMNRPNYQRLLHSGQKVWRGAGTLKTKKIRHSCVAERIAVCFEGGVGMFSECVPVDPPVRWPQISSFAQSETNITHCFEKKDDYRKWTLLRHSKFHHQPHHFRIFKNKLSKHTEMTNLTQ